MHAALAQTWPPFVLVAGLLPIALAAPAITAAGLIAIHRSRLFGSRILTTNRASSRADTVRALDRASAFPGDVLHSAGSLTTSAVAAGASVLVNNLPAAVLLSAKAPAHASALLLGLNLGPNLAVTGSLSALLWWRAARTVGARPSVSAYSRQGLVLAPIAILGALAVAGEL
jgi:hypothetical protein